MRNSGLRFGSLRGAQGVALASKRSGRGQTLGFAFAPTSVPFGVH